MKFYFCEKCGRRVTETDLERGDAKDKKLKGMYCTECSAGVLTMEMQPISDADARKILSPSAHPTKATGHEPAHAEQVKRSAAPSSGQIKAWSGSSQRHAATPGHSSSGQNSIYAFSAIAALLASSLCAWLVFSKRGDRKIEPEVSSVPKDAPSKITQTERPAAIPPPLQAPPSTFSTPRPSVGLPPVLEGELTPERRAQSAFDDLLKFEGLAADDKQGRAEKIQAFLDLYGDAIVAARARVLLQQYTAPPDSAPASPSTPSALSTTPTPPAVPAVPPVAQAQLVAYWSLDDGKGTTAADASGRGHPGTLAHAPTWVEGKFGGGLHFNGTESYLVADGLDVDTTAHGRNTVAFWMKWSGVENQMPFRWNVDGKLFYDLYLCSGTFGINTGESDLLGFASEGMANRWVHVAAVFPNGVPSPKNTKLYLNGAAQTVSQRVGLTSKSLTATPRIFLGSWERDKKYPFEGALDEVRIYRRELAAEEVRALAAELRPPPTVLETPEQQASLRLMSAALDALAKNDRASAMALARAEKDAPREQAEALAASLDLLIRKEAELEEELRKRIGQDLRLETGKETVQGRLSAVEPPLLKVAKESLVNGVVRGTYERTVALEDLTEPCRLSFMSSSQPATPEAWIARALARMASGNFSQAEAALAHCDGHPLQAPLRRLAAERKEGERQKEAAAAWSALEARSKSVTSLDQAKTLLKEFAEIEEKYAGTPWAKDANSTGAVAALKEQLESRALGLDPLFLKLFKGKIAAWDPATQILSLTYDFSTKEQTEDFAGAVWAKGRGHSWLVWQKNELKFTLGDEYHLTLVLPQFASNDFKVTIPYKDLKSTWGYAGVGVFLFTPNSPGTSEKLLLGTLGSDVLLRNVTTVRKALPLIFLAKVQATSMPPTAGQMEFSSKGRRVTYKLNGNVVLQHELQKENDHQGFAIGGGEATFTLTGLQVTGRLDRRWLEKALHPK